MIHSTKITIIDYFLYQWWSDHQNKKDFWGNCALEAIEVSEVAEAAEVNEAGEVSKAWKIATESSRFLNSIIWGQISLYFDVLKKKCFNRIMKIQVEF